jgi:hypothetical protein
MELMVEVLFEIGNGTLITARYQDIIHDDNKSLGPASRGVEKEVGVSCTRYTIPSES